MILLKLMIMPFLFSLCYGQIATLIKDIVQFNIAGHPVLHKDQMWHFDPDVGIRRSRQYKEQNGYLGEKAIERLGLGIDGFDRERLAVQRVRDEGHLGGVDYNGKDGL